MQRCDIMNLVRGENGVLERVMNSRIRFIVFTVLIVGLFFTLVVQLAKLTIVDGEEYAAMAAQLKERESSVSGARGSILDRNGLPLAYDQKSYNVQFYRDPMKNQEPNKRIARSTISMARSTPAQNPRGLASRTFISVMSWVVRSRC